MPRMPIGAPLEPRGEGTSALARTGVPRPDSGSLKVKTSPVSLHAKQQRSDCLVATCRHERVLCDRMHVSEVSLELVLVADCRCTSRLMDEFDRLGGAHHHMGCRQLH